MDAASGGSALSSPAKRIAAKAMGPDKFGLVLIDSDNSEIDGAIAPIGFTDQSAQDLGLTDAVLSNSADIIAELGLAQG